MLKKCIKFLFIGLGVGLVACGQKFEAKKTSYTYENPNLGIAVPMRPTSENAKETLKNVHNIEFIDPKVEVSIQQKTVRFQVTKVTNGKSEAIELTGQFDDQFHVWMSDTAPVNGMNRLKAFAYCLESAAQNIDCSSMFIELHFKHQGKEIKHQLEVGPYEKKDPDVKDEPKTQGPLPLPEEDTTAEEAAEADKKDPVVETGTDEDLGEGTGEETTNGSFVVPPPDEKYWDNIQALLQQQSSGEVLPASHSILDLTNAAKFIQTATTPDLGAFLWHLSLTDGGRAKGSYIGMYDPKTKKTEYGSILEKATQLPKVGLCHTRYSVDQKAFATGYASDFAQEAACVLKETHKQCDLVDIGNLSYETGGRVRFQQCIKLKNGKTKCYHTSHQNGLEYDIHYLSQTCNYEYFKIVANAKNQLGLHVAHAIFVQPSIKQGLCTYAKSRKLNSEEDKRVFEVLNGEAGHADHSHVRLKCSPGHVGCWQQDPLVDRTVTCRL
jgi:hypothetical protein